ncbi:MAG TPA: 3'-5' exonuclease [Burkholderiales bacterium]|nr:3'-5' exonuclease [Burkholderiales bacterium]
MVPNSITKDEINALPIKRYEGSVVLVATAEQASRALEDFSQERLVGFDTETRPTFKVGEKHPVALAQVATARAVYLFQLARMDCAPVLRELLQSTSTKAGVGIGDDLKALRELFAFEPAAIADLGAIARKKGYERSGVRALSAMFLGFRIPKGTKTSNWAAPRLSPQQIGYAATDAWACRELYLRFETLGMV